LLDLPANQQGAGRLPLPIAIGERAQHDEQAVVTDRTAERREHVIVELDIAQPEAAGIFAFEQGDFAIEDARVDVKNVLHPHGRELPGRRTVPTVVSTAIGPLRSICRSMSASVRNRVAELIRSYHPQHPGTPGLLENSTHPASVLQGLGVTVDLAQQTARARLMLDSPKGRAILAKMKTAMMKAAMTGLYHTGAHRLLAPYTQGLGAIFILH
jgi:hypothetical protein